MADARIIIVQDFKNAVSEIVEQNIEFNNETMLENIREAANLTRHKLAVRNGEWVGRHKVGHDRMFHRKGWKIYRENWYGVRGAEKKPGIRSAVVATKIEPSLTHLLEFGHRIVVGWRGSLNTDGVNMGGDWISVGGRTRAFHYMRDAFEAGKNKLLGAKVDNP